jgi:hypothetical protein
MVSPLASLTASVNGVDAIAVPAVPEGMPLSVNVDGTPSSVAVIVFTTPIEMVAVVDPSESALPMPFEPENVVIVNASEPGGTDGPLTVHPEVHEDATTFEVTEVTRPAGGPPPLTVFSVIVTDALPGDTYSR